MIVLTIALAVFVGISLGLLGGGGSILTVPLLAYVAGMDAKPAIATSLLVVGDQRGRRDHPCPGRPVRWKVARGVRRGGDGRGLRRRPAGPGSSRARCC